MALQHMCFNCFKSAKLSCFLERKTNALANFLRCVVDKLAPRGRMNTNANVGFGDAVVGH